MRSRNVSKGTLSLRVFTEPYSFSHLHFTSTDWKKTSLLIHTLMNQYQDTKETPELSPSVQHCSCYWRGVSKSVCLPLWEWITRMWSMRPRRPCILQTEESFTFWNDMHGTGGCCVQSSKKTQRDKNMTLCVGSKSPRTPSEQKVNSVRMNLWIRKGINEERTDWQLHPPLDYRVLQTHTLLASPPLWIQSKGRHGEEGYT